MIEGEGERRGKSIGKGDEEGSAKLGIRHLMISSFVDGERFVEEAKNQCRNLLC